jgi:hypothetical protein
VCVVGVDSEKGRRMKERRRGFALTRLRSGILSDETTNSQEKRKEKKKTRL